MDEEVKDTTEFLITTIDNPFNPFTQSDEWYNFDKTYGHNTYQLIARFGNFTPDMTEEEEKEEYLFAINKILRIHPMYIKVKNDSGLADKLGKLREIMIKDAKSSL